MLDNYWKQFYSDGKVESYLKYVENEKKQEYSINGTNSTDNGLFNNQGKEYR